MDHEESAPAPASGPASAWPPPHPSPPEPPPREYGSPGTPPDRNHWVWAVAAAVVVVVLMTVGVVYVVRGDGDDSAQAGTDPTAGPTSGASEPPTESPTDPADASFRCWDGAAAAALQDCPLPEGAAGLAWVFPKLSQSSCGDPTRSGSGVVMRILCVARFSDGSRVQLGYYQWESVAAGVAFYDEQGLDPADAEGFHSWTGTDGEGTLKSAVLYADAPFSQTVTLPADAQASEADLAALQPRPPDQVRGEPVG